MKNNLFLTILLISIFCAINVSAQNRDNENEVVLLNRFTKGMVAEGDVIVKFTDDARLSISNQRGKIETGVASVDAILNNYTIKSIKRICPQEPPKTSNKTIRTYNGVTIKEPDLSKLYLIKTNDTLLIYELIDELKTLDAVEYAEPNYILFALDEQLSDAKNTTHSKHLQVDNQENATNYFDANAYTSEPMYSMQWGISAVGLDLLWAADTNNSTDRPIIAILDTGVDTEHPDLAENIWQNPNEETDGEDNDNNGYTDDLKGWDFVNQTANIRDNNSHGTHCAGIAAAIGNNGIGITGANPNALIMPITVLQSNGAGDVATIIQGISYAKNNGADILNMSFGTYTYSEALYQALASAYQSMILVAATGNDGVTMDIRYIEGIVQPFYPAAFSFVLGVQATMQGYCIGMPGELACFSNYDLDGPSFSQYDEEKLYNYELSAPGSNITSTVPNGLYKNYNGTSMSAPLVAGGISALIHAKNYTNQETLWGDLINSNEAYHNVNFYDVYSNTEEHAKIQFVSCQINDTLYGDGDNRADAGETIELYPTIRNLWANTDSIRCWIEFEEFENNETLHFLNNNVDFGYPLASYAHRRSLNPIRFEVDSNVVDGRIIRLNICAISPNSQDTMRQYYELTVENGIELHGIISENTTLYPNVHYIITNTLAVPEGVTLTIKPGTTIKIADNIQIYVEGTLTAIGTPDSLITFTKTDLSEGWKWISLSPNDTMIYCQIEYGSIKTTVYDSTCKLSNLILKYNNSAEAIPLQYTNIFYNNIGQIYYNNIGNYNNLIDNNYGYTKGIICISQRTYNKINHINIFNNTTTTPMYNNYTTIDIFADNNNDTYCVLPITYTYIGTSIDSIANKHIWDTETQNSSAFADIDETTICRRPHKEAHGIVWKVLVNGYDAQDEFDSIAPLGIGKHRFDVYFNRAMDTSITPFLTMGVRPPYTQKYISEDAFWSEDSTIYTAYLNITATTSTDGLNRIYVANAQDNEHFEIPYENRRFNVQVATAGSLGTGLMATAGMGKIDLEWNYNDVDMENFLGCNIYRYQMINDSTQGIHRIANTSLIQDAFFTDYNVEPGEAYYYYYKVLNMDLMESSPSHTVSATPLSALIGDVNSNYTVDIADVVSLVGHIAGQNPSPFIYAAADINSDGTINVLDIVGLLNIIAGHQYARANENCDSAIYYINENILYIESAVEIAGIQVNLKANSENNIQALSALQDFERIYYQQTDSTAVFLAYSMQNISLPTGTHPILNLDNTEISEIILSDPNACSIKAVLKNNNTTNICEEQNLQLQKAYPNPFHNEICIPYIIKNESIKDMKIIIYDIMGKAIENHNIRNQNTGNYEYRWKPDENIKSGIYFIRIINEKELVQTSKIVYHK